MMSSQFKVFMLVVVYCLTVSFASRCNIQKNISDTIYEAYENDTKTLFKVWHFIHKKSYNYNTEEGI